MIVKDEENVLARCLDSVKKAVDEIIIVDTGSVDRTKSIAEEYTDLIYDFEWENDFAAARNFA
ncbi:MAG: glycosyltransferase, partial [Lachnoclostridium sp.]|nr:glycosyltransferase [Lachnoclostridium sp.]